MKHLLCAGILLCTANHETVVRYALGGMDERIFVSRYKLHLPDESTLRDFMEKEKSGLTAGSLGGKPAGRPS